MRLVKILKFIYKAEHPHFLSVDKETYFKWSWLIKSVVGLNKSYKSCEIFRKKYKIMEDFVVIGLKYNGKNVKRRTSGFAKEFLDENSITYIREKKFESCKNIKELPFDFYLPEYNTIVEFDGEYHFGKKRVQQNYITQVFNDREKNDYTKAKNIKLIRIGYLDKGNIEEELMKGLDSNDQLYLSTKYPIDKGWRDTTIKV